MPEYFYTCACGQSDVRHLPMREASFRPTCKDCGKRMERDFVAEHRGTFHRAGLWPMKSEALGVLPSQIAEAKAHAAKHGISVDFTPEGEAILSSRQNRKEYAELYGFHDREGGYGDPQSGERRKYA